MEDYISHSSPTDRVRNFSPQKYNNQIDKETNQILFGIVSQGPDAISARLKKLDREWDIDRALMFFSSAIVFTQVLAAYKTRHKKLLYGPLVQVPFLFLYSLVGWCPPVPVLRKMGFRTRFEIEREREILMDFLFDENRMDEWNINQGHASSSST